MTCQSFAEDGCEIFPEVLPHCERDRMRANVPFGDGLNLSPLRSFGKAQDAQGMLQAQ